jgi:DNA adenine methylase
MRFNSRGCFNVPFCRKPDRFRSAYITKIANQVRAVQDVMRDHDWTFISGDWRDCLSHARPGDFVYLDPPYIGRHTGYYNQWNEDEAAALAEMAQALPCGIALSMWNRAAFASKSHRRWVGACAELYFYHVGPTEVTQRNDGSAAHLACVAAPSPAVPL